MLDVCSRPLVCGSGAVHRRDFVRVGALGIGGLTLADSLRLQSNGQTAQSKAKAVIQLWMAGGPSHLDTFDPKPEAGTDYCGPYRRPIATNVPGIRLCETLPLMARQADKYSIIRSLTHGAHVHETATYIMQTCTPPDQTPYPSLGAVVARQRSAAGNRGLPPYMSLLSPIGRFQECGFVGADHRAFVAGGDPNTDDGGFASIVRPSGDAAERLLDHGALRKAVDALATSMEQSGQVDSLDACRQRAYALVLEAARDAFEMSQEKPAVRDRYGRHTWGQACLLARRLVEHGVPFITVNFGGWDTHRDHFGRMKSLLPPLDQAFSALLEDLAQRGLLDTTLVTWFGEFSRTPRIDPQPPWDGGRHHHGHAQSVVVAGGGFRGGVVVGETDAKGEFPKSRTLYPWDLSASLYALLGIDPGSTLPHPHGCLAHVTPRTGGELPGGGLLTEIM